MAAIDFDKVITETAAVARKLDALVRLANDHKAASFEERRTAALSACELIARAGVLEKIAKAQAWFLENRVHFERAQKAAALIQTFRGR